MTAKYSNPFPTGLFIPVEKQSLFMLTFEDMLVSVHNVVPIFGSATDNNSCEVIFDYKGSKSYKPESFVSDIDNALKFLETNMSILGPRKCFKRKRKSSGAQTSPQIINLEDESEEGTVDLTNCTVSQPEIIVLEDSIVYSGRQRKQSSRNSSIVDLTNLNECDNSVISKDLDEITILGENRLSQRRQKSSNVNTPSKVLTPKNKKRKRKKSRGRSLTRTINNHSSKTESSVSPSSTESLKKKKRKLQDISNTPSASSCSTSSSLGQSSTTNLNQLSENTLKYYEIISKAVSKTKESIKKKRGNNINVSTSSTNKNMKRTSLTRKLSPVKQRVAAVNSMRKTVNPNTGCRNNNTLNNQGVFNKNSSNYYAFHHKGRNNRYNSMRTVGETNSFNPNPEVVLDGLRPIVIDGCNVAIGHGKGKFSPKGLKICVDYFAARGHTTIKIFLPQFRETEFSTELLESIKTKSDVVFTPSQCINGQRRTPYDDRFIVQYATEFGGVIVSTDNYRDLSKENPRWQDTIAKRLLMFTWVDDFLMFPVDPLGRSGPTLEDFLRF